MCAMRITLRERGIGPSYHAASHEPPHELGLGAVEITALREHLVSVFQRLGDEFVEVLPLSLLVVDDLGEAMAEVVAGWGMTTNSHSPKVVSTWASHSGSAGRARLIMSSSGPACLQ